jgi:uncharacterized membrane protein
MKNAFDGECERQDVNVGRSERWLSGIAGAALIGFSLGRRRLRAVLVPLGGVLIGRAVTGRCEVNRMLGRNSARGERESGTLAGLERGEGTKLEQAVVIERPRAELFQFWRNFENLPRFMDNLESVTVLGPRRSHWVAKGPAGTRVEWDAEIEQEIENELISWRSLPGADVDQVGSVHFSPVHNGGTEVRIVMRYAPPAGKLGGGIAHIAGEDPAQQVADDLRRFKQVMDAREVPSSTS